MMNKTKEPLYQIGRMAGGTGYGVCCQKAHSHHGEPLYATAATEEFARRIVACVNACKHISTESLESGLQQNLVMEARIAREQRDELLAALVATKLTLELANDTPNGPIRDTIWYGDAETLFDFIDAALEKVGAGGTGDRKSVV